jgi:hypothetical protein
MTTDILSAVTTHPVRTTGINWTAIGVISTPTLALVSAAATFIVRRVKKNRELLTTQIQAVAQALGVRLDTSDERLSKLDDKLDRTRESLARLEGPRHRV